jgi:osmotically-inducible protein OsmY
MKFRILMLGFSLSLTACTTMVIGGAQTGNVYDQHDGRTLQQVSDDAAITQQVQDILENNKLVDVDTSNGIVTLQGTVSSQREVQRIINQAYRIGGVKRVESHLLVNSP